MERRALPSIVFWALFILLAGLEVTNPHWYSNWTRADWLNLGVAGGTLALAGITAWNVLVTQTVLKAENRRHRQSAAPIVNMWLERVKGTSDYALLLVNQGPGPAINVHVECVVTFYKAREQIEHTIRFTRNVLTANGGNKQTKTLKLIRSFGGKARDRIRPINPRRVP